MNHRFSNLFESRNGHGNPRQPTDEWKDWIVDRHPKLVEEMIDEVTAMALSEDDLAEAYVAVGRAMMYAGTQFFFDTVTGVIYPSLNNTEELREVFPKEEVLRNLTDMRKRTHELIDQTFEQYTTEFVKIRENEMKTENDSNLNEDDDSELDDPDCDDCDDDDSDLDDESELEEWEEVDNDDLEEDED